MNLIERLRAAAKWHDQRRWQEHYESYSIYPSYQYSLEDEDARALYTEAAERIEGLSLLVNEQCGEKRV